MSGQRGIVGIVDGDYWLILRPQKLKLDNILYDVECPDLEVILLTSDALKKSLRHDIRRIPKVTVPVLRIENFRRPQIGNRGLSTRYGNWLLRRLLNESELMVSASIAFGERISSMSLLIQKSVPLMADWFARRLANHHKTRWIDKPDRWIPYELLLEGVYGLFRDQYPMPNIKLCRGKDVVDLAKLIGPNLLEVEFAKELSRDQLSQITFDRLDTDLRKSYELRIYFAETSLYRKIRRWECESGDFRVIGR